MKLDIAVTLKRTQKVWKNKKIMWDVLVAKLANTQRTNESFKEYLASSKSLQSSIKDVGGFVGGYLDRGRRSSSTIRHRQIVTLDIDDCPVTMDMGLVDRILENIPYELVIYSTHKHSADKPRLRVVFPLDRPVTPDEYEAIARHLAGEVGIDLFDPTTFQPSRFMYWPSTSHDGDYVFHHEAFAPICEADDILAEYVDWSDMSAWPRLSTEEPAIAGDAKRLGDPTEKDGVIGAFCRAYDVENALATFLTNVYVQTEGGRYTYQDGSSSGGGVVYNGGSFFYSNHGTDPAGQTLLNSFDLVRIHKFGALDGDSNKPMSKRESYLAMCDFAIDLTDVKAELDSVDRPLSKSLYLDFAEDLVEEDWLGGVLDDADDLISGDMEEVNPDNVPDLYLPEFKTKLPGDVNQDNWKDKLERTKKGEIEATISNLKLILLFDEIFFGKLTLNEFAQTIHVVGALPWNKSKEFRVWDDDDEAGLLEVLETKYDVYSPAKTGSALRLASVCNKFHPVKEFLSKVTWDGTPRLDTLFVDYLGAEDSPYTRAVTRKAFTAAVARVMKPGCKYDYVVTLVGAEGLRKSSLLNEMGGRWFSDSFTTVEGTKAFEQIQGAWIVEIAELSAFNRSETNAIKSFVTRRTDKFRAAYARTTKDLPRQCVFFATTNDMEFLEGHTGNRRFWPVYVTKKYEGSTIYEKSALGGEVILGLPVQQLWAEAKHYFEQGEKLYLDENLEAVAHGMQDEFSQQDTRLGRILNYLDMEFPDTWDDMLKMEKKEYVNNPVRGQYGSYTEQRDTFCTAELWELALGLDLKDFSNYKAKELTALMRRMGGWERKDFKKEFGHYGVQKHFRRMGTGNKKVDG